MPKARRLITEAEAIERAEAFIADKREEHRCGKRVGVRYWSREFVRDTFGLDVAHGRYCVTFEYVGPPTPPEWQAFVPAYDSPTSVEVNDRTGNCSLVQKL